MPSDVTTPIIKSAQNIRKICMIKYIEDQSSYYVSISAPSSSKLAFRFAIFLLNEFSNYICFKVHFGERPKSISFLLFDVFQWVDDAVHRERKSSRYRVRNGGWSCNLLSKDLLHRNIWNTCKRNNECNFFLALFFDIL